MSAFYALGHPVNPFLGYCTFDHLLYLLGNGQTETDRVILQFKNTDTLLILKDLPYFSF